MSTLTPATQPPSYRFSHIAKGGDYARGFVDRKYRALLWELERTVLDEIVPAGQSRALAYLDFACGTGRVIHHLEDRVKTAVGVDVSASMLSIAEGTVRRAELHAADLTREARFEHDTFDLVTAFRFFPNAEPELRSDSLKAIHRVLKVGGRLVFNSHINPGSLRNRAKRLVRRRTLAGLDRRTTERIVRSHEFTVERVYPLGVWPGSESPPSFLMPVLEALERRVAGWPAIAPIANNLVFVCRKHGSHE
jgi:ubiquinone/menaquinone biosynthesis C-methylase UbiE